MEKINESKSRFFEKINKIIKLLTRCIKKKRERAQMNKIRNEKEKLKIELPHEPAVPLLGIYSEKTIIQKDICTPMIIALFTIAKTWEQPKCPSTDERIEKMWYIYIQWNTTRP